MPGLRGTPDVMTTTSLWRTSLMLLLPVIVASTSNRAPHWFMSSALPIGMSSTMSMSVTSAMLSDTSIQRKPASAAAGR